jgi:hypothetical protein
MRSAIGVRLPVLVFALMVDVGCVALGLRPADYQPRIDPTNFQATVDNPYYPLVPGTTYRFVETARGDRNETAVTVTHETKRVMGVECVVVHDVVTEDGEVAEETYAWIAQDKQGNVWSFGEGTQEISAGGAVSTAGSWEAGVDGAQPGILMPANPTPGEPYRQGYRLGIAEDMAEIEALGESATVPAGTFTDCVRTEEWSELESGSARKWYAWGVGAVRSEATGGEVETLVSITRE